MITRRNFLTTLIAAPAIVRCSSLMSLRGVPFDLRAIGNSICPQAAAEFIKAALT